MIKRVCLLTNYNLYESKRYFTNKLVEAMHRHGIETLVIDVNEKVLSQDAIISLHLFNPDFTCSFNSFEQTDICGRYLCDFLELPHLSFLVDPSFYSTTLTNSPYSIISCVDRKDCSVILSNNFENVFFWPHAVERELVFEEGNDRPYDVVFMGSCYDYESLRASWQQRNPEAVNKVLDAAIDIVFSNDQKSLAEALVEAWNSFNFDPDGVDFTLLYLYLDNYTRGKDRVELIRSIKNARVHVFGELAPDNAVGILGWQQYLAGQQNVVIHDSVPFGEGMNVLKQSKVVLNSMPFFRDGSHERIFTALACGCLPVSSESIYLREQFKAGEEIIFYKGSNRAAVGASIDELLANENKRQQNVMSGCEKVLRNHTWDNRVEELIKVLPPILERMPKKEI